MRFNGQQVIFFLVLALLLLGCTQLIPRTGNDQINGTKNNSVEKNLTQRGYAYDNPSCDRNYDCLNNTCSLKTGCGYNNPPCDQNHSCDDNACVLKQGCDYGNPSCEATYVCTDNVCILNVSSVAQTGMSTGVNCSDIDQRIATTLHEIPMIRTNGILTDGCEVVTNILSTYNGFDDNQIKEQRIKSVLDDYDFSGLSISDSQILHQKLIIIANSLWVDKNKLVPWSLKDYSQKQLDALFWVNSGLGTPAGFYPKPSIPLYSEYYSNEMYGTSEIQEEGAYKLFGLAYKFLGSNQSDTINSALTWQKQNFFHAYFDSALGENWGWDAYNHPLADGSFGGPKNLDELFNMRITGCHDNAFLLAANAKSLNIPAVTLLVQRHGVVYFPTINRYVHGDHIADFVFVPSQKLLLQENDIVSIYNRGSGGYSEIITDQYAHQTGYSDYLIATQGDKHRNNDGALYLRVTDVAVSISPEQWNEMQAQVPEFTLHYNSTTRVLYSDLVQIHSLSELSDPNRYTHPTK